LSHLQNPDDILNREVRYVKGVGPRRAERLARLGICTIGDLLFHLPRDYEDRRRVKKLAEVRVGERCVVSGTILGAELRRTRTSGRSILQVRVSDGTGIITLLWFNAGYGWKKAFPADSKITAYGEVAFYGGLQMVAPDYEVGPGSEGAPKFDCILPVYPLTEGISQRIMRALMHCALREASESVSEILPAALIATKRLLPISEAVRQAHFPSDMKSMQAARRRLAYEELFVFQTALALRRHTLERTRGISFKVGPNVDAHIRSLFPFQFTEYQEKVIREVARDMRAPRPMYRLLQGDVGCGKTVVALYAMLAALAERTRGYQTALMAPTEILAEQHYLTLQALLQKARVRTLLLTGGVGSRQREANLRRIARGDVDLVVGTHALIQKGVEFRNLALIVVDEQHRFGVRQRLAFTEKGPAPDVLIMTATPIPRTLALAYFADMDTSVIEGMPPGRRPVQTFLYGPARWQEAFDAALRELRHGYRAFVIYPLVENNKELDLTSATEGYRKLSQGVFREFDCCLLHGQMPTKQKQSVMEGFRNGAFQVMVATTVVEVGIDVPQATVMIIQHAERLGLAQLHQLRGRIGRSKRAGRCFLLAEPTTEDASSRLRVLTQTSDGFKIAEEDLRLRGPGQFFGTEQSGFPEFRCYDFSDVGILEETRRDALELVRNDPSLSRAEHKRLRAEVLRRYGKRFVFATVG